MLKKLNLLFLISVAITGPLWADADIPQETLFERLGGEPAVTAVIDEFVARAAANPAVNFTRKDSGGKEWEPTPENLEKLKKHLVQFVSVATGATDVVYEGKDMKSVHEGMKISNAEFDAIAGDLKGALEKFNVPEREQQELLTIVGTTRGQIVEEPAEEEALEDLEEEEKD